MELQKQLLQVYDAGNDMQAIYEDSTETIAPDYCPDIARITAVKHQLFIHSCTALQDKITISGTVGIDLLYIPQDSSGVRRFHYEMPFAQSVEHKGLTAAAWSAAEGRIASLETRLLNPRKVFTRLRLEFKAHIWQPMQLPVTVGVAQEEGVELRMETAHAMLYHTPAQKSFSVEGDVPLNGSREEVEELLHSAVRAEVNETRIIGGKILVKGTLFWEILYRSVSRRLCRTTTEVPFSQIMAAEGISETASFQEVHIWVTQEECRLNPGEEKGRTATARAELTVFGIAAEEKELSFVSDLYSTKRWVTAKVKPLDLPHPPRTCLFRQTVREVIEPGVAVDTVVSASVRCIEIAGAGRELSARLLLELLYLDENGVPLCAERQIEVRTVSDCDLTGAQLRACVSGDDVMTNVSGGNAELRFTVEFHVRLREMGQHRCVNTVEEQEQEAGRPALVLRSILPGETPWELAKKNRVTIGELLTANGLEPQDPLPMNRLLLIPSR